jgi:peptidoglycan/xylan/chitin deacetylase (PgdA/CDA1 family)
LKIIISHDIDHIRVSEHFFRDTIVPKFIVRSHLEWLNRKISLQELLLRFKEVLFNRWEHVRELNAFNKQYQIPATFFIATAKGTGLNYSNMDAKLIGQFILEEKVDLGIHGIAHDTFEKINNEHSKFCELFGSRPKGNRMHYLKNSPQTFDHFRSAGIQYDSTLFEFINPYWMQGFWEFPIQLMDGWVIECRSSWQKNDIKKALDDSKRAVDKALKANLNYFTIDFHDRYFSPAFQTWMDWYTELIHYLHSNKFQFTTFENAIQSLELNYEKDCYSDTIFPA